MQNDSTRLLAVLALVLMSGCRTPGTKPQDMSVAGHDAAAARLESEAAGHDAEYDSDPRRGPQCLTTPGMAYDSPCWLSGDTFGERHAWERARAARAAADHRAASSAMRAAEAAACDRVTPWDRDVSPFAHPADIASVQALEEGGRSVGARVVFNGTPGLTLDYLQRQVRCHVARNAAMGFAMPEMTWCPLAVKGARAEASSSGTTVAVTIRADGQAALEVLRRARALVPARP